MSLRKQLNSYNPLKNCWNSIYSSKQKSKRPYSKGADNISIEAFKTNEKSFLPKLEKSLLDNSYRIDPLAWFTKIKQEKNTYRLITSASVKDRIVQKRILDLIHPCLISYIDTGVSYCGVKKSLWKKDTESLNTKKAFLLIIKHIRNNKHWVFKADIKGFYDNVPKRKLYNLIEKLSRNFMKDESLNTLIKDMIFFKLSEKEKLLREHPNCQPNKYRGICQGSALSQFFANIYLADFDRKMKSIYGDKFIRYIDDFIIFCDTKGEAQSAKTLATKLLKYKKLELSSDANKTKITTIQGNYVYFLGLRLDKRKITTKRNNTEIQIWIKNVLNERNVNSYKKQRNISERIESMNFKVSGYGEYLRYYHTYDTYKEINKWIKEKKREKSFKGISYLDEKKIKPIISQDEWQSLFF